MQTFKFELENVRSARLFGLRLLLSQFLSGGVVFSFGNSYILNFRVRASLVLVVHDVQRLLLVSCRLLLMSSNVTAAVAPFGVGLCGKQAKVQNRSRLTTPSLKFTVTSPYNQRLTFQLFKASTFQGVSLSRRQLVKASACQGVSVSRRQLFKVPAFQGVRFPRRQLFKASAFQGVSFSRHQLFKASAFSRRPLFQGV